MFILNLKTLLDRKMFCKNNSLGYDMIFLWQKGTLPQKMPTCYFYLIQLNIRAKNFINLFSISPDYDQ